MKPFASPRQLQQLQQFAQESAQAGGANPADFLANLQAAGASDPWINLMSTMLNQRSAEAETATELDDYRQRLKRARNKIILLQKELEATHVLLTYFSQLFGACSHCWGQDADCRECAGRGSPGAFMPLEEELLAWAAPALRRLGYTVGRRQNSELLTRENQNGR